MVRGEIEIPPPGDPPKPASGRPKPWTFFRRCRISHLYHRISLVPIMLKLECVLELYNSKFPNHVPSRPISTHPHGCSLISPRCQHPPWHKYITTLGVWNMADMSCNTLHTVGFVWGSIHLSNIFQLSIRVTCPYVRRNTQHTNRWTFRRFQPPPRTRNTGRWWTHPKHSTCPAPVQKPQTFGPKPAAGDLED